MAKRNVVMTIALPEKLESDFRLFSVTHEGKILSVANRNDSSMDEISENLGLPQWDVTFIWGFSMKMVTLSVYAENEDAAVETAFEQAGSAFENRLISVRKRIKDHDAAMILDQLSNPEPWEPALTENAYNALQKGVAALS